MRNLCWTRSIRAVWVSAAPAQITLPYSNMDRTLAKYAVKTADVRKLPWSGTRLEWSHEKPKGSVSPLYRMVNMLDLWLSRFMACYAPNKLLFFTENNGRNCMKCIEMHVNAVACFPMHFRHQTNIQSSVVGQCTGKNYLFDSCF